MNYYEFPGCGCKWQVLGPAPEGYDLSLMNVNPRTIPFCSRVEELLSSGRTKGVFQLEKQLGQTWAREVKPESHEHVAALVSILRPGCLKAKDENGVSTTQHYARRKNGKEQLESFHLVVDEILQDSYGLIIFQEQAIKLAIEVAGFTATEADTLRSAIGKKLADEMTKMKYLFLEGADRVGKISREQAEELFAIIEKSSRYNFNRSHAWSYGRTSIITAYIKAHFPLAFYLSWLGLAYLKQDSENEIYELIEDAKYYGIQVLPPDIRTKSARMSISGRNIVFGLADIAGISADSIEKGLEIINEVEIEQGKTIDKMSWQEYLIYASQAFASNKISGLIAGGAFSYFGVPRLRLQSEYDTWRKLTEVERKWVRENWLPGMSFQDIISAGATTRSNNGMCSTTARCDIIKALVNYLKNPPTDERDTPLAIAAMEQKYLGVCLTMNKLDACDTSLSTSTCAMLNDPSIEIFTGDYNQTSRDKKYKTVAVQIRNVRETKTRNGDPMAFLSVFDNTGSVPDVIAFSSIFEEHRDILRESNTVMLTLSKSNRGSGWIIETVQQI